MNTKLLILLVMSAPLYAMDPEQRTKILADAFNTEKDYFDDEVSQWYSNVFGNVAKVATGESDYEKTLVELSKKSLLELCGNKAISEQAKKYWKTQISNELLSAFYQDALDACKLKKSKPIRTNEWKVFRNANKTAITNIMKEDIGLSFPADEEPKGTFLSRMFEANKNLKLDDHAKVKLAALTLVQHAGRQIHRKHDEATDDANLLLSKEVTDQQKTTILLHHKLHNN